jgi:hypothetical protein
MYYSRCSDALVSAQYFLNQCRACSGAETLEWKGSLEWYSVEACSLGKASEAHCLPVQEQE